MKPGRTSSTAGSIDVVSPATDVCDNMQSSGHPSTARLVMWAVGAFFVSLFLPLIVAIVTHVVIGPGFVTFGLAMAVVLAAWLAMVVVALAWVVAGGRLRRAGAAIIFGESLGLLAFAVFVWWVLTHHVGSN